MPDSNASDPRGRRTAASGRLDSWKEIAAYLQRDIRTLHRWERHEGLPVHRHHHRKRGTVYAFRPELDAWREDRRLTDTHPHRPPIMLAVLPFESLSSTPDDDYFSDGFTEDVITELGRLRANGFGVIARTSVMQYKRTRKPVREIARELRVDYVLEGSVRRVGEQIRVTAQLILASDETHVWADAYDGDVRDVLRLQDTIARTVAAETGAALNGRTEPLVRQRHPLALDAYLKGQFHWYKLSREHLDTALRYFELALTHDARYALAYEGIARVWLMRGDTGSMSPLHTAVNARRAALRALDLDPDLPAVYVTLGNIQFCTDWDWPSAAASFRRALELNPNSADARLFYADFLISLGHSDAAATEMARATELDPFNFFLRCFQAWHLVYQGDCESAVAVLTDVLKVEPRFSSAHLGLWGAHYRARRYGDALAAAREFFRSIDDADTAGALRGRGGLGAYRTAMRRAARLLDARAMQMHVAAVRVARAYAHAGDADSALEWLERAYERRESPLVHLNVGWDWQTLRGDPRFDALLAKIGLPAVSKP